MTFKKLLFTTFAVLGMARVIQTLIKNYSPKRTIAVISVSPDLSEVDLQEVGRTIREHLGPEDDLLKFVVVRGGEMNLHIITPHE